MTTKLASGSATPITQATSLKRINTSIGNIAKSAAKLQDHIHQTALLCFQHASDYGDCSPCARLVDAIPMSHRRSLLINWFARYSPIKIAKDAKKNVMKAHLSGNKDEREWLFDEAKANPFFALPEAEREPDVPLTFEGFRNNVINMVERLKAKAKKIEDKKEQDLALAEIDKLLEVAKSA